MSILVIMDAVHCCPVRDLPAVLTVEEAAAVLRVGRTAGYEAVRRGEIPTIKIGRSLRVPRARLLALLGEPVATEDDAAEDNGGVS